MEYEEKETGNIFGRNKMLPNFMKALTNLRNANAQQLEWLLKNRCVHRHTYLRHFSCFIKDFERKERVAFIDIETSNLKANFGIVLCWCILDEDGDLCEDYLTQDDVLSGYEDRRIVSNCVDAMCNFDRIIGHYSTYFDVPFLRTRALIHHLPFPEQGTIYHTDVWKMAKHSLCLHSNRQDVIAESLYGKTQKTRISHPAWRQAMLGDEKAAREVLNHCEKDVLDLKRNYETLKPYCREVKSSI
jgi:uncharacterized protein YprB with RNaseH-like and TPR domain